MNSLPEAADAGERLKRTALRDFGPDPENEPKGTSYKMTLDPDEAPVPSLLKYALTLIGLKVYGPGEKVARFVNFTYRGEPCVLAYEKFGLRLYLRTEAPEEEARKTQVKVAKQLRSSMRVVEKVIMDAAPELLGKGEATVVNQHRSLRRAYEYFRERALEPTVVEDETIEYGPDEIAGIQCEPLETTSQMAWWGPNRPPLLRAVLEHASDEIRAGVRV